METNAPFGTSQLFLADSRLALIMLNHLRHQGLNRVFDTSREQANALPAVLLLGAAGSALPLPRDPTAGRTTAATPTGQAFRWSSVMTRAKRRTHARPRPRGRWPSLSTSAEAHIPSVM
jgi:hypothetical protein